jgi:hypothetical protein
MSEESTTVPDDVEAVEEQALAADAAVQAHFEQLEHRARMGANWFFWIAGLSIINTFMLLGEANRQFVIGLGITQIANGIVLEIIKQHPEAAAVAKAVAYALTFLASTFVAAFGIGARYRLSWVFIVGMTLYAIDGLLFVLFQDWLSVGFHVFALAAIYRGLSACRELKSAALNSAPQIADAVEAEPA